MKEPIIPWNRLIMMAWVIAIMAVLYWILHRASDTYPQVFVWAGAVLALIIPLAIVWSRLYRHRRPPAQPRDPE